MRGGEDAEPWDTENLGFITHSPPFPVELMLASRGDMVRAQGQSFHCCCLVLGHHIAHFSVATMQACSLEHSGPPICFQEVRGSDPDLREPVWLRGCDLRYLMRSCPCLFRCICDETFAVHFFFSIHCCREDIVVQCQLWGGALALLDSGQDVHLPASFLFLQFPLIALMKAASSHHVAWVRLSPPYTHTHVHTRTHPGAQG